MPLIVRFSQGKDNDVFRDAAIIRDSIFIQERGVPASLEHDGHDAYAIHLVLYEEDASDNQKQRGGEKKSLPIAAARLRLVRHCGVHAYDTPVVKVERVCVRRPHRGKGYGVFLMKEVEKYAREKMGISTLVLHAKLPVKKFYKRLGFHETSDEFMESNISHITMSKM
ncbi:putative actyltransferase-like [Trypanosoma cruzi]|uniref:Actyltransferase-like protein n=1 Tax=Trypanosoma cruzi TaxID=5693 RepID=A0A2V2V4E4_TRYCR|nr:actyltransferase-like [Trypanosoma cruzi cruzi]PWU90366.1 actyltransferase-like protein [Trypanosoma cruzi]RNF16407.1 putative actyltransferase-like [Trypanosoma cruzi]